MMPIGHIGLPLVPFLRDRAVRFDARLLMIGGFLPDLIDKPLGHLLLPINNGRIFAHTLIFALLLLCLGIAYRKLLPLSLGVTLHHLFDNMHLDPGTAVWPLMGPFPSSDFRITSWFAAFLDPQVFGWELLGALVILGFFYLNGVRSPRDLFRFALKGALPSDVPKAR